MSMYQFRINKISLNSSPYLSQPVGDDVITLENMSWFDNPGYTLNNLECYYHDMHDLQVSEYNNSHQMADNWVENVIMGPISINHSKILTRYGYVDHAFEQIKTYSGSIRELTKLLKIRPKYGLDMLIDYTYDDVYIEVLHFEWDFIDINNIIDIIGKMNQFVAQTDFGFAAKSFIKDQKDLRQLGYIEQSNIKAKYFGFGYAFKRISI